MPQTRPSLRKNETVRLKTTCETKIKRVLQLLLVDVGDDSEQQCLGGDFSCCGPSCCSAEAVSNLIEASCVLGIDARALVIQSGAVATAQVVLQEKLRELRAAGGDDSAYICGASSGSAFPGNSENNFRQGISIRDHPYRGDDDGAISDDLDDEDDTVANDCFSRDIDNSCSFSSDSDRGSGGAGARDESQVRRSEVTGVVDHDRGGEGNACFSSAEGGAGDLSSDEIEVPRECAEPDDRRAIACAKILGSMLGHADTWRLMFSPSQSSGICFFLSDASSPASVLLTLSASGPRRASAALRAAALDAVRAAMLTGCLATPVPAPGPLHRLSHEGATDSRYDITSYQYDSRPSAGLLPLSPPSRGWSGLRSFESGLTSPSRKRLRRVGMSDGRDDGDERFGRRASAPQVEEDGQTNCVGAVQSTMDLSSVEILEPGMEEMVEENNNGEGRDTDPGCSLPVSASAEAATTVLLLELSEVTKKPAPRAPPLACLGGLPLPVPPPSGAANQAANQLGENNDHDNDTDNNNTPLQPVPLLPTDPLVDPPRSSLSQMTQASLAMRVLEASCSALRADNALLRICAAKTLCAMVDAVSLPPRCPCGHCRHEASLEAGTRVEGEPPSPSRGYSSQRSRGVWTSPRETNTIQEKEIPPPSPPLPPASPPPPPVPLRETYVELETGGPCRYRQSPRRSCTEGNGTGGWRGGGGAGGLVAAVLVQLARQAGLTGGGHGNGGDNGGRVASLCSPSSSSAPAAAAGVSRAVCELMCEFATSPSGLDNASFDGVDRRGRQGSSFESVALKGPDGGESEGRRRRRDWSLGHRFHALHSGGAVSLFLRLAEVEKQIQSEAETSRDRLAVPAGRPGELKRRSFLSPYCSTTTRTKDYYKSDGDGDADCDVDAFDIGRAVVSSILGRGASGPRRLWQQQMSSLLKDAVALTSASWPGLGALPAQLKPQRRSEEKKRVNNEDNNDSEGGEEESKFASVSSGKELPRTSTPSSSGASLSLEAVTPPRSPDSHAETGDETSMGQGQSSPFSSHRDHLSGTVRVAEHERGGQCCPWKRRFDFLDGLYHAEGDDIVCRLVRGALFDASVDCLRPERQGGDLDLRESDGGGVGAPSFSMPTFVSTSSYPGKVVKGETGEVPRWCSEGLLSAATATTSGGAQSSPSGTLRCLNELLDEFLLSCPRGRAVGGRVRIGERLVAGSNGL